MYEPPPPLNGHYSIHSVNVSNPGEFGGGKTEALGVKTTADPRGTARQRRIIPTLQRHFPNVQIFASTHSPMMVAGLKKGQVHLLKRDATGQVVWSRNEQDIIGWTADEIYRTFMGIDDPTDERTARHAEELRELRNKDNLTPENEARMQELRRLVNEDLLAGGWLKAQDERFDEMMRRFMADRMSDLSQDGA